MSLTPKIDEVREFIIRNEIDLALITETWLKESVSDTFVKKTADFFNISK